VHYYRHGMRVVHLLASTGWGGAERVACTLHRLATTHGHASRLDGPALPMLVAGVATETGETLPATVLERARAFWALGARTRVRAFAPDVVHVHLATPRYAATTWFIAGSLPLVVTFHLLPPNVPWAKDYLMPVHSERVLARLGQRRRRPTFVAVSAADRANLETLFPGADTAAVVNAPPLSPVRDEQHPVLPFPKGVVRLLSVGRLDEQKGFDRLVSALADPRVRSLPWHWVVVGDGGERARLEASVVANGLDGRVTFAGFTPAHHLYEQSDLVLCPSRFEGMPLVPLEVLLSRKPVLVSRIPPHQELLGAAPASFLPESDTEWAAALVGPLSDPTARAALLDAQSAVSRVDPRERLWQDYLRIYERVLHA